MSNILKKRKRIKKLTLAVIATIAFGVSSFASNEIVFETQIIVEELNSSKENIEQTLNSKPCVVEIWGTNSKGERILKSTHQIKTYPYKSCSEAVGAINAHLAKISMTN